MVVVVDPGGSSEAADGVTGPLGTRVACVRRPAGRRSRRRENLVGLLARADELVLLPGDAADLPGVAQVLLLLGQRGVLGMQRRELRLGAGQV